MNWFWIGILPQMHTAILTSKLEIIMIGLLFWATASLMNPKMNRKETRAWSWRWIWIGGAFGMTVNWKFQPVPVLGLLTCAWFVTQRNARFLVAWILGTAFWFLLPFVFLSGTFLGEVHRSWRLALNQYAHEGWMNFDNLFAFLHNALGLNLTEKFYPIISIVFGGAILASLLIWIRRAQNHATVIDHRSWLGAQSCTLALGLGSLFPVVFSPLSQNNGYILYAPLLFLSLTQSMGLFESTTQTRKNPLFVGVAWGIWLIMSFAYSDIVPFELRASLRHASIKPAACLLLGFIVVSQHLRSLARNSG